MMLLTCCFRNPNECTQNKDKEKNGRYRAKIEVSTFFSLALELSTIFFRKSTLQKGKRRDSSSKRAKKVFKRGALPLITFQEGAVFYLLTRVLWIQSMLQLLPLFLLFMPENSFMAFRKTQQNILQELEEYQHS